MTRGSVVWALDGWDAATGKATVRLFSSKEDAERAKERWTGGKFYRYAEVLRRVVK